MFAVSAVLAVFRVLLFVFRRVVNSGRDNQVAGGSAIRFDGRCLDRVWQWKPVNVLQPTFAQMTFECI